jgi:secondary thiamine-phosphate synthase enzyme
MVYQKEIHFETKFQIEFVDVTQFVHEAVSASKVRNGQAFVFVPHTTMGVVINHNESLLIQDFVRILYRMVPVDDQYTHDLFELKRGSALSDGRSNGHSHCKAMLIGTSETIPIIRGELALGLRQSVFAVELDGSRKRTAIIQVVGE